MVGLGCCWLTLTMAALVCRGRIGLGRGSPSLLITQFICRLPPLCHIWVSPYGLQEPHGPPRLPQLLDLPPFDSCSLLPGGTQPLMDLAGSPSSSSSLGDTVSNRRAPTPTLNF